MWAVVVLVLFQIPDPAGTAQFEPLYREEVARVERQYGATHPKAAQAVRDLALFVRGQGRPDEARDLLRRVVAIEAKPDDLLALAELSPPAEAGPLLERSLGIKETPEAHHRLADLLAGARQLEPAEKHYERAIAMYQAANRPEGGVALNDLGFLYENTERYKQAEALYRRALAAHQRVHGAKHPEVATTLNNLGSTLGAQGRFTEAEPLVRRALTMFEQTLTPVHERIAACAANLADMLGATNRAAAAKPLYERAAKIYDLLGRPQEAADIRSRAAAGGPQR
ncbi:MAG: tetratricopeptide repeat protein [Bryobacterales bacterium]|nr:tetratricopeptide repeat protein [Bryobacterales bacterium]